MFVWFDVRTHSRESVSLEVDTDTDLDLVNEQERRDNRQLKSTEVLHAWRCCARRLRIKKTVFVHPCTYGVLRTV